MPSGDLPFLSSPACCSWGRRNPTQFKLYVLNELKSAFYRNATTESAALTVDRFINPAELPVSALWNISVNGKFHRDQRNRSTPATVAPRKKTSAAVMFARVGRQLDCV